MHNQNRECERIVDERKLLTVGRNTCKRQNVQSIEMNVQCLRYSVRKHNFSPIRKFEQHKLCRGHTSGSESVTHKGDGEREQRVKGVELQGQRESECECTCIIHACINACLCVKLNSTQIPRSIIKTTKIRSN